LRFGKYLGAELPLPPAKIDWGKNVSFWPMYLNDRYADCTCAAAGHLIQTWTAAVGKEKSPTDAQVLKFYEHFTTPGPFNNCDMLSVLKFWRTLTPASTAGPLGAFNVRFGSKGAAKSIVRCALRPTFYPLGVS
jgi:hypothetical protein